MALAVAVAVIAALGLAASVNYAFASAGSTQTSTATTTETSTTTVTSQSSLGAPQVDQLKENGTTTINGTTYWYVSFIPNHGVSLYDTVIIFHGVTFTLTEPFATTAVPGYETVIPNMTLWPGGGYLLPTIKIAFGGGTSTVYNDATITVKGNVYTIIFDKPTSNPWFSEHTAPQAGIGYGPLAGQMTPMTLYVSTS